MLNAEFSQILFDFFLFSFYYFLFSSSNFFNFYHLKIKIKFNTKNVQIIDLFETHDTKLALQNKESNINVILFLCSSEKNGNEIGKNL